VSSTHSPGSDRATVVAMQPGSQRRVQEVPCASPNSLDILGTADRHDAEPKPARKHRCSAGHFEVDTRAVLEPLA
jgi:hypothetical protein